MIILSISLLLLFGYTMVDAEYLSLREPSETGRNQWIGRLAYKNKSLIFITSLIFNALFSTLFIDLITKLKRQKLKLSIASNKLYLNGNFFVSIENIHKIKFVKLNNNSSVIITLNDAKKKVKERDCLIETLKFKLHLLFNKNNLRINISYLKEQPEIEFKKIEKFIKKSKTTAPLVPPK